MEKKVTPGNKRQMADDPPDGTYRNRGRLTTKEKDLDCTNANSGLWLVKVPKYISQRWEKAPALSVAGKLKMTKGPMNKTDIMFTLADDPVASTSTTTGAEEDSNDIPTEHTFAFSDALKHQSLAIFSQTPEKLVLEGHVVQRGELRPLANEKYMMLKRQSILKASQPVRQLKQIQRVVQTFKPVANHRHNIEFEQKKKAEGKKARDDKDKVMGVLFNAFEKHQYYNIKDLEKITKQPITYLKEILKEICNYNAKNPHKSMWELKPEFRFYKEPETAT